MECAHTPASPTDSYSSTGAVVIGQKDTFDPLRHPFYFASVFIINTCYDNSKSTSRRPPTDSWIV